MEITVTIKGFKTIEEAARTYGWRIKVNTFSDPVKTNDLANSAIQDFTEGAKWAQERLYNEEEVLKILKSHKLYIINELRGLSKFKNKEKWFEQYKKK